MNIDITQIAVGLIGLMSTIITSFLIPWIRTKIQMNNDKITDNQKMLLKLAINTAVKAAEQLYNSEQGKEKKAYVLALLEAQGYLVDDAALDAAIEAAVLELHRNLPE